MPASVAGLVKSLDQGYLTPMASHILRHPDSRLRDIAKPVETVTAEVRELVATLTRMMRQSNAVGLAAPQLGVSSRVFVVQTAKGVVPFINPELVSCEDWEVTDEGCCSLPGLKVHLRRAQTVTIKALGLDGKPFTMTAGPDDGLVAQALQHESDHLDGVLMIDHSPSEEPAVPVRGTSIFAR